MIITRNIENGVELNWLPPVNPNGVITSYEIEYTTNSTFTTISGTVLTQNSSTHYNWTGPEFPTYYMRVRAVNSANTDTGTMYEPSNVIKLCLGKERSRGTYMYYTYYSYLFGLIYTSSMTLFMHLTCQLMCLLI